MQVFFRVSLKRAIGGSITDYSETFENEEGVALKDIKKLQQKLIQKTDKHDKEDVIISWQMKVFSKVYFIFVFTLLNNFYF